MILRATTPAGGLLLPRVLRWSVVLATLAASAASGVPAQQSSNPFYRPGEQIRTIPANGADAASGSTSANIPMDKKAADELNRKRVSDLEKRTARMVELARHLTEEVSTQPQANSVAQQLKQLEEIEKLAHHVQQRMTESWAR